MSDPSIDVPVPRPVCVNTSCEKKADRLVRVIRDGSRPLRRGEERLPAVSDSSMCAEHAELYVRLASVSFEHGPTVYVHRLDDGVPVTYFCWAPEGQGVRWDAA